jgi:hypothetical protein
MAATTYSTILIQKLDRRFFSLSARVDMVQLAHGDADNVQNISPTWHSKGLACPDRRSASGRMTRSPTMRQMSPTYQTFFGVPSQACH